MRRPAAGSPARPRPLTGRERDVIRLIAAGLTDRATGLHLGVAETTVRFDVRNILRTFGVSRRAHAVYQASRIGLV